MRVIQCPICENELTEKTAKFRLNPKGNAFKMHCGICHHTWNAELSAFYESAEAEKQREPALAG